MNPNRPTPRHIIIKMAKVKAKKRILKSAREKQRVIYKRTVPPEGYQLTYLQKHCSPEGRGMIYSSAERENSAT